MSTAIKDVEKKYRVYAVKKPLDERKRGYGMDHSTVMYLMGPDGKLVSFYDEAISPDDLGEENSASAPKTLRARARQRQMPFCAQAAISVLCIRQTMVMAPTPPGTGVMAPATSFAAS